MIFSVLLAVVGVGILAALLFNAAVYALPVVVGVWTLQQAIAHGSGAVSAIVLAIIAGAAVYAAGHFVFETNTSRGVRLAVALLFAIPALLAGYELALTLFHIGLASSIWLNAFAALGGLFVAACTVGRLAGRPSRSV